MRYINNVINDIRIYFYNQNPDHYISTVVFFNLYLHELFNHLLQQYNILIAFF